MKIFFGGGAISFWRSAVATKLERTLLGHVVSSNEVATNPDKIGAIKEWKEPTHMRELQALLGTAGYYRQYLLDYATTAKPLTSLVGKDGEWQWGPDINRLSTH